MKMEELAFYATRIIQRDGRIGDFRGQGQKRRGPKKSRTQTEVDVWIRHSPRSAARSMPISDCHCWIKTLNFNSRIAPNQSFFVAVYSKSRALFLSMVIFKLSMNCKFVHSNSFLLELIMIEDVLGRAMENFDKKKTI